jgi:hypothetical protein
MSDFLTDGTGMQMLRVRGFSRILTASYNAKRAPSSEPMCVHLMVYRTRQPNETQLLVLQAQV